MIDKFLGILPFFSTPKTNQIQIEGNEMSKQPLLLDASGNKINSDDKVLAPIDEQKNTKCTDLALVKDNEESPVLNIEEIEEFIKYFDEIVPGKFTMIDYAFFWSKSFIKYDIAGHNIMRHGGTYYPDTDEFKVAGYVVNPARFLSADFGLTMMETRLLLCPDFPTANYNVEYSGVKGHISMNRVIDVLNDMINRNSGVARWLA